MKKFFLLLSGLAFFSIVNAQTDTTLTSPTLPAIVLTESELEEAESSTDLSGLLQSSDDVFVSTAGYSFGSMRFRIRGLDSEFTNILLNGVRMNDPETGRAYWSNWGGLNDAVRNKVIANGIAESDYGFGSFGGITNIITRASTYRPSTGVSYAASNRSYRNRVMLTHATGLMDNGWALTISGSRRWANESYQEGTFYDGWSYFMSVEKHFNKKHSIGLIAFAAPTKRGSGTAVVQEAYDLAGTNYYNPYWGYQDGEKRNARVSNYNQPMIQLSHYWNPNQKTEIQTTAYYWFGRGGSTALDWADANDPRPDYYRNLPSYFELMGDEASAGYYREQWMNNENFRQLNWDHFYFANSKNLATINNVEGIAGNNVSGNKSKYIVEDRRMDKNQKGLMINLQHQLNAITRLSGGAEVHLSKTRHHKVIEDLLGGDFYLDVDKFSDQESSFITDVSQSDLRKPNRLVREGDIFGYDYYANQQNYRAWGQASWKLAKVDLYAAAELSGTTFWRTGNMQNGRFPDNSYGDSDKNNFFDYGLKAGASYALNGRNYLVANAGYSTRAPYFRDVFISPRTRHSTVEGLTSSNILSGDLSYVLRTPDVKARLTVYHTKVKDDIWLRSFYHEDLREFVNYIMKDMDQQFQGIEFGSEFNLSPTFSMQAVAAYSENIYTNRPNVTISRDNDAELLADNRTVYLKNYHVGGMPQTALSMGIKYNSPKFWWVNLTGNYFDRFYFDPNPDNHTAEGLSAYKEGDVRINQILDQPKLEDGFTLDFFGGKSWRVNGYYISLILSVNNILNNQELVSWGYEQLRSDLNTPDRFPDKYSYLYGTTYFVSLTIRK
ncbi:MAG: TonB-dependent receptor plug domain-containing protein [Bacteroidales bacterium]|nr:TonB-dependent receptor plug domain-containing protein [Bacteroidales bacterium]